MAMIKNAPVIRQGHHTTMNNCNTNNYTTKKLICQEKNSIKGRESCLFDSSWLTTPDLRDFSGVFSPFFSSLTPERCLFLIPPRISRQKKQEIQADINLAGGKKTPEKSYKSGQGVFEGGSPPSSMSDDTGIQEKVKFTREYYESRLKNCGKKYVLLRCKNCGKEYAAKITCGLRTCPNCARTRANKLFLDILRVVKTLRITPIYKLRSIVLTYGTDGTLRERVQKSKEAFRKIWHNVLEKKGAGAVVTFEFGPKNKSGHLHILYFGPYVPYERLKKEWKRITGKWDVNIKLCRGRGGIREVTKYISKGVIKGNDITEGYEIEKALRGLRRVATYGCFYNRGKRDSDFKCPVCGCSQFEYVEILDAVEDRILIQDILWRWRVFEREKVKKRGFSP
jgi:hypothetical protein